MDYYYWIKAIHLVAVFLWVPSLLVLGRFFVYQVQAIDKAKAKQSEDLMEVVSEWDTRIATVENYMVLPTSLISLATGLLMAILSPQFFQHAWFQAIFLLLIFVFAYQFYCRRISKDLRERTVKWDLRRYKILNEAWTIVVILIVILAVVRPINWPWA